MGTRGMFGTIHAAPREVPRAMNFGMMAWREIASTESILTGILGNTTPRRVAAKYISWEGQLAVMNLFALSAAVPAATCGTITVLDMPNATLLNVGKVLQNTVTGEQMRVVAVSGTKVSVYRGFGTPAYASPAGAQLRLAGNAFEEGSYRPLANGANNYSKLRYNNYMQILRNSYAMTGTARAIFTGQTDSSIIGSGNDVWTRNKAEAAIAHAQDLEEAYLFSMMSQQVVNGQLLTTMDGFIPQIHKYAPQNVIDLGGAAVTQSKLFDLFHLPFMIRTSTTGDNDRVALASRRTIQLLTELDRAQYNKPEYQSRQINNVNVTRYVTPDGHTINLMHHPKFDRMPGMVGTVLIVDPDSMHVVAQPGRFGRLREMNAAINADTSIDTESGVDGTAGDYLSEVSLVVEKPHANMIIRNLCAIGLDPALAVVQANTLCIDFSHPCAAGPVKPGTVVNLSLSGGNPGQVAVVTLPDGQTVDATLTGGSAVVPWTVPANALPGSQHHFNVAVSGPGTQNSNGVIVKGGLCHSLCLEICIPEEYPDNLSYNVAQCEPVCETLTAPPIIP